MLRALKRAPSRDRTNDLLITSQLLYQLSYGGNVNGRLTICDPELLNHF